MPSTIRIRPKKGDKASVARVNYYKFEKYTEKWDEIKSIFSREAILKGSFDKYADGNKRRRGTAGVDNAFLEEIENWRTILARNIALRNPTLSIRELNAAVQRTIDRIIFLRIAEDRGMKPMVSSKYSKMVRVFTRASLNCFAGLTTATTPVFFTFVKVRALTKHEIRLRLILISMIKL